MHRLAIAGLVLLVAGIGIALTAPESNAWRIGGISTLLAGVALFVGALAYRIIVQNKAENIIAEIVENIDE